MPPIRRLLVANRGEIASRVMRTARRRGISTVAVYSSADAGLPFVRDADMAVELPGASASATYLDIGAVLGAVRAAGADAVHPGYGFLSENASFARACAEVGVNFVGPPPAAIEAMGSKLAARDLMSRHDVPVLPGGLVSSSRDIVALGEAVGWPLLLKASFGGGGRGMRLLRGPEGAAELLAATQREAASAFGDGPIFAERFVEKPRHIEIQVMADSHGNVVHLFERECSIQRRYQKILEECPSPAVGTELRAALGEAAVTAARAIGYEGAGTVEFVVDPRGRYYFLEVNTRLQVEHPVTEAVTGLDLVELQLLVAEGEPLPAEALSPTMKGHAVEARLYAEDVAAGYAPVSGRIEQFELAPAEGVRVDAGYESGSDVSPYYDAMLAKVVAWAPSREVALARLAGALQRAVIHGPVTNRDLLVSILRHPDVVAGMTDTGFLERNDPVELAGGGGSDVLYAHAVAAALAAQAGRRSGGGPVPAIPSGWRNVRDLPQRVAFSARGAAGGGPASEAEAVCVSYVVAPDGSAEAWASPGDERSALWAAEPAETDRRLHAEAAAPGSVRLVLDSGIRVTMAVSFAGGTAYVDSALGHSALEELPRFGEPATVVPGGSLVSPMPGVVTAVLVGVGDTVASGEVIMFLEAMKMEHPVRAPADGEVAAIAVATGGRVDSGTVLAVIQARGTDETAAPEASS